MRTLTVIFIFSFFSLTAVAFANGEKDELSERLANPASVLCKKLGGDSQFVSRPDGVMGLCSFGRSSIEEWTLWKQAHNSNTQAVLAFMHPTKRSAYHGGNPASEYCQKIGGTTNIVADDLGNQNGLCSFADNSFIEEWTLFRGTQDLLNAGLVQILNQ